MRAASIRNPVTRRRNQSGSSLLLVIWSITMASIAVLALVEFMDSSIEDDLEAGKQFHARLLADSALILARHPQVRRFDPILSQQVSQLARYEVAQSNEGTRIAVNHLADNPILHRATRLLFERWGLDVRKSAELTDAIADWIDPDDEIREQGTESRFYTRLEHPEYPLNRPFRSLEELLFVRDFELIEALQPEWRDYFTLFGDGKIDVNEASPLLLQVLFDLEPHQVLRVIDRRLGDDEVEFTADDVSLDDLGELAELLDLPDRELEEVLPTLTLSHPVRRIVSRAQVGDATEVLTLIEGPGIRELIVGSRAPSTIHFPRLHR